MGDSFFLRRFNFLFVLFVASMILLIFRPNIFSLMLGWDGLGVVSFCLVIFYSDKVALVSGLITIYINRIGDAFMIFCIYYSSWWGFWGLDIDIIGDFRLFSVFLFLASLTRRAQYPFSAWLPAAMSAPTPISSLVHSSTLVTAGVYLVIRFYFVLRTFFVCGLINFLSRLTILLAGLSAIAERDLRRVVAMSTLRQLGLIFYLLSVGEWAFSFYHLIVHALFKSLIFLTCGGFIYGFSGDQDYRFKGGSYYSLPLFGYLFRFSSLGLVGFPFLAGFYSRDAALDVIYFNSWLFFSYFFFLLGCVLTVIYSFRLFFWGLGAARLGMRVSGFFKLDFSIFCVFLLGVWALLVGPLLSYSFHLDDPIFFSFPFKMMGLLILLLGFSFSLLFLFFIRRLNLVHLFTSLFGLSFFRGRGISFIGLTFWPVISDDYRWLDYFGSILGYNFFYGLGSRFLKFDLLNYLAWLSLLILWFVIFLYFSFWGLCWFNDLI